MDIIKNEGSFLLLEQYGKKYLRFEENTAVCRNYQIALKHVDFVALLNGRISMETVLQKYIGHINSSSLMEGAVIDYLKSLGYYAETTISEFLAVLHRHEDIFLEFHDCVLQEKFKENGICVLGHTAKSLFYTFTNSLVGAFIYLVYLREEPVNALFELGEGVVKDFFVG